MSTSLVIGIAGCLELGEDDESVEITHYDKREVSQEDTVLFDVTEDEETEIYVKVIEEGSVDIELKENESGNLVFQDTLVYEDSPVEETYVRTLEPETVYALRINPNETTVDFSVTAIR